MAKQPFDYLKKLLDDNYSPVNFDSYSTEL